MSKSSDYESADTRQNGDSDMTAMSHYTRWGETEVIKISKVTDERIGERVRRRGRVFLSLTSEYGRKSGMGIREGVRELLKTLCVTYLEAVRLTDHSVDNVRVAPDGSLRQIEWVCENTDDRVATFLAHIRGPKQEPGHDTGLFDQHAALGYIIYRRDKYRLILVNKNTSFSRQVWSIGGVREPKHYIGSYGTFMYAQCLTFRGNVNGDNCAPPRIYSRNTLH